MKKLYKFYWDCGRMGNVKGLFVATPEEIEEAMGKQVYFGEILGKHSEIYGDLEEDNLTVVSEDQDFIKKLVSLLGVSVSGYNPLEYLSDEDDLDEED